MKTIREVELEEKNRELQDRINKAIEKLNTQLAFTSNYQLNYQSAMYLIKESTNILKGDNK